MKVVYMNPRYVLPSGAQHVDCLVVSDTTPEPLPTSGAEVDGMRPEMRFAPMSVLYVVDPNAEHKIYVANENGEFVGQ